MRMLLKSEVNDVIGGMGEDNIVVDIEINEMLAWIEWQNFLESLNQQSED